MIRRLAATPVFFQVAALVLTSILAAQAVGFAIVLYAPPPGPDALSIATVLRFIQSGEEVSAELTRDVSSVAPFEMKQGSMTAPQMLIGKAIAESLATPRENVRVLMLDAYGLGRPNNTPSMTQGGVAVIPAPPLGAKPADPKSGSPPKLTDLLRGETVTFPPFVTAVRHDNGDWFVFSPRGGGLEAWRSRILLWFLLAAAVLTPLAWFIASLVTRPIRAFAEGVERFGSDPTAPPLEEGGPREVRSAIAAFNRMQSGLRAYVNERSAMVAAIAHDLRTPLTSLRFRAEAAPELTRDRMIADIERMNAMTAQVMDFVRGEQKREALERLDLGRLVQDCVQDIANGGAEIICDVSPGIAVMGEPLNLRRALTNLIDNAVKFGGSAEVSVTQAAGKAIFRVDDHGPGMPDDELEKSFDAFHRGEPSRSRQTGGMGLGLALVRTVVRANGGEVTLSNRASGGLSAVVSLKLA